MVSRKYAARIVTRAPNVCPKCKNGIDRGETVWWVRPNPDSRAGLYHLNCLQVEDHTEESSTPVSKED